MAMVMAETMASIRLPAMLRRDARSRRSRRPRANWAIRAGLGATLAIVGCLNVAYALAPVVARDDIELAHRLSPRNEQIMARLAKSLSGPAATARDRERADGLAREALRRDATTVAAVSTLGLNAEIRGERAKASRLFAYAQTLSRRDRQTQLWAIESAVGRDDIPGALRHYDITLRVSPKSAELLFPVLIAASTDSTIRSELTRTLAKGTPWGEAFINYIATNGRNPQETAILFVGLRRAGVAVTDEANAEVVNALAASGHADAAWKYYATVRPGTDRRRSRDPRFSASIEVPSQLDWVSVESPGISASIQRGDRGGIFEFSAPASVGGSLLQQLQMLPPGIYRLTGHSSGIEQPADKLPYWLLTCHDGREFGRVEMPNSARSNGNFTGLLTVPTGCGIQMLALVARPVNAASGLWGQIDRVYLEPAR